MKHRPAWLDIDQLLIFFLLAVTINQMGHYLSTFAPSGLWWIGYLQAVAIDFAIWRSAWWYRRYTGRKQRRWALVGVVVFACVSAWYNQGYYKLADPSLPAWQCWLMGAILPLGVALLSFLKGMKDESKFGQRAQSEHERIIAELERPIVVDLEPEIDSDWLQCDDCEKTFQWPEPYKDHRAAQNALNAHRRKHDRQLMAH